MLATVAIAEILLSCLFSLPTVPREDPKSPAGKAAPNVATAPDPAADPGDPPPAGGNNGPSEPATPVLPVTPVEETGVAWNKVGASSMRFLGVMHAFRWATEPGTRQGGVGLGRDYRESVSRLHGWGDGDPFYVNYVGHPMQGAVAARLFLMNDGLYRKTEFGKSADYWKGRLRATAFAAAFSEQFETGPVSEASIGHIQRVPPQQGFVDHVITPVLGMCWMLAEDALDEYVIKSFERHVENKYARLFLRGGLNPARSFANVLSGRPPWYRDSRPGVLTYTGVEPTGNGPAVNTGELPEVAPLEFSVTAGWRQFAGQDCIGGGAEAAYRARTELQVVMTINGCKLLGLERDRSGDALVFQVGPRWTPAAAGRWSPYTHLLFGGMKVTTEQLPLTAAVLPEEKAGLAISAGVGVDYKLSSALALRVASVEYSKSNITSYSTGIQVSTGMVLRWGTW